MNKCLNQNMLLLWEHAQLQGGMFITDSYSTVREVDKLILVDVYLPGWPNDSTVMVSLACGSLSGITSSTATFPLDLVRRRMQLEGAGGRVRVYNTG
ncbi:hypothetical protein ACFX1Q_010504 [Malus domestica]